MSGNFWTIVNSIVRDADVILLVVDARMIERTDNQELRRKVRSSGKTLITVLNKADLVEKESLDAVKKRYAPCVFVSTRLFYGMTRLRNAILRHAPVTPVTVGVVGYPNTGKSSVVNALKGRSSAPVSSESGFTKGRQHIKVDTKIRVIDSPGVLSSTDATFSPEFMASTGKAEKEDPDIMVQHLLRDHASTIMQHYGLSASDYEDEEEMLEAIAFKLNRLQKGGEPDVMTTARIIIQAFRRGDFSL